jgi:hypothetical protein
MRGGLVLGLILTVLVLTICVVGAILVLVAP